MKPHSWKTRHILLQEKKYKVKRIKPKNAKLLDELDKLEGIINGR